MSDIALKIGGNLYTGWKEITINRTMEALSGVFSLSITDNTQQIANKSPILKVGQNCQVLVENVQILDGYIDKIIIKYNENSHSITVIGRDKAGDLVDCSVTNGAGGWRGLKIEQIIQRICDPFGIKVTAQVDTGAVVPFFQVEQGMSAFEAIQKLCSARGCLAISDSKGGLLITRAGQVAANTEITQGVNILLAEAEYDFSDRYSKYTVKGQDGKSSAKWEVVDQVLNRYRPLLIVGDGQIDTEKARIRARWEAAVKAGKSRTFTVSVNGWLQKNKKLWEINQLVKLNSSLIGVNDSLLVAGIIYSLTDKGQITELALVDKITYSVLPDDTVKKEKKEKVSNYIS